MESESQPIPITPMTVRPKRVLLAISVGLVMLIPVFDIYARAQHRYRQATSAAFDTLMAAEFTLTLQPEALEL